MAEQQKTSDHPSMTNEHTPATPQDLDAVQLAAQKRQQEILLDADNLALLSHHVRESNIRGSVMTSILMARCARTLRELVS